MGGWMVNLSYSACWPSPDSPVLSLQNYPSPYCPAAALHLSPVGVPAPPQLGFKFSSYAFISFQSPFFKGLLPFGSALRAPVIQGMLMGKQHTSLVEIVLSTLLSPKYTSAVRVCVRAPSS